MAEALDDFDEPNIGKIGNFAGVDDLPKEGWPDDGKAHPIRRTLDALTDAENKDGSQDR